MESGFARFKFSKPNKEFENDFVAKWMLPCAAIY